MIFLFLGHRGPNIYRYFLELVEIYDPVFKIEMPFAPTIICTTSVDDIERLMRSTVDNPVRFGFESLKYVRDNAPGNFFNKKAGLLPE